MNLETNKVWADCTESKAMDYWLDALTCDARCKLEKLRTGWVSKIDWLVVARFAGEVDGHAENC